MTTESKQIPVIQAMGQTIKDVWGMYDQLIKKGIDPTNFAEELRGIADDMRSQKEEIEAIIEQLQKRVFALGRGEIQPADSNDAYNYVALAAPFATPTAGNQALTAFFKDLRDLRQKHKIPDVLAVASINVAYPDGRTGAAIAHKHNGDSLRSEAMAAWLYGTLSAERRELLNKLIAGQQNAGPLVAD